MNIIIKKASKKHAKILWNFIDSRNTVHLRWIKWCGFKLINKKYIDKIKFYEFIRIKNGHASVTYTVRITAQTTAIKHPTYGSVTKSNTDTTVAPAGEAYIGPFKQGSWSDTNNKVQVSYRTTSTYASGSAIGTGSHLLQIEILYLEN